MTNIIILSSLLVTNWGLKITMQKPNTNGTSWGEMVREGTVTRFTTLGMKTGTNTVFIGSFECVAGRVIKTNDVCGPMMPWKEEE